MVGSLTGAVASQMVTEARDGGLKPVGHRLLSAKAQARLTVSATARTETKVGLSDPVVPRGRAIAQRIKGWSRSQGFGCSPIKAVRELGLERRETVRSLSAVGVGDLRGSVPSTRGPGWTYLWCTSCSARSIAG